MSRPAAHRSPALQLACMHVFFFLLGVTEHPHPPLHPLPQGSHTRFCMSACAWADMFNRTWSCWCIRAYLSSEKRASQAPPSHRPFTEQQRGAGQRRIGGSDWIMSSFLSPMRLFSTLRWHYCPIHSGFDHNNGVMHRCLFGYHFLIPQILRATIHPSIHPSS